MNIDYLDLAEFRAISEIVLGQPAGGIAFASHRVVDRYGSTR
ncbi:MAG: hypothetical protein U9N78_08160 [Actinomycetota bacterium]|nr:hypothetical protein [Actinomycetota bacterium]